MAEIPGIQLVPDEVIVKQFNDIGVIVVDDTTICAGVGKLVLSSKRIFWNQTEGRDYLRVVVPDYTKTFCIGDRGMDDEDDDPVLEVKFIPQTDNQATLEVMEAALREDLRS